HALRGSAATLGLLALAELCEKVERRGLAGEPPTDTHLADLTRELDRAAAELADFARSGFG
ncbi:MAG: hypothetical protein JWM84_2949, partial [Nocardioides sp.]|nr:hypothetical protein [Nocardioides sp.]